MLEQIASIVAICRRWATVPWPADDAARSVWEIFLGNGWGRLGGGRCYAVPFPDVRAKPPSALDAIARGNTEMSCP